MRNSQEVEDFNLFTSPLSHPVFQKGDSMIDLEELKRDLKTCQSMIGSMCAEGRPPKMSIPARPNHDEDIIISTTINRAIAKLEAAQRLRLCIKAWIESVPEYSQLAKNLEEALATFDKEQS